MKKYILIALSTLTAISAFAQNINAPQSVSSTTYLLEKYSPQSSAVTIKKLCEILSQDTLQWGNSKIVCIQHSSNGLIEIKGNSTKSNISVFANADDKTVYEDYGSNQIQLYQNNLGQILRVEFIFVNTGVVNKSDGSHVQGYYQMDVLLKNNEKSDRVGYFDNLN